MDKSQVAEHLRFYEELGVDGISRDSKWRSRAPSDVLRATCDLSRATSDVQDGTQVALSTSHVTSSTSHGARSTLHVIREDIGDCIRCKLHAQGRTQIVFGVGNPDADLMFVGEAPGADEDIQGIPFVGRAGQLLTKIIEAIGLSRDQVYIANVIKCRPPGNRNPDPDEVESCEPFLFRQIDAIKPRVIVALGTFAAKALLKTQDPISRLRGRIYDFRGAKLIPTFHPAFLLRSPERKRDVWEDMKKVRALLQEASSSGEESNE